MNNPYLKIKTKKFFVEDISCPADNLLKIVFADKKPSEYGGKIESYTAGGYLATTFSGYETVYKEDENTVLLSNDGSVYTELEPVEPVPYEPTLEEVKASKRAEISTACHKTIEGGVDVKLTDGSTEHFSLSTEDQLNLFGKQVQMAAGAEEYEYHADGQPCKYYSAADMQAIITAAMQYVSYHTTYCNSFFAYIDGQTEKEAVQAMQYGDAIPEEYKSEVLKAYETTM